MDDAAADLVHFGLPEAAANLQQQAPPAALEIWPQNWDTVTLFCAMGSQWNWLAGMAGVVRIGLRYESVPIMMDMHGIAPDDRKRVFRGLQVMESAALAVMQKKG